MPREVRKLALAIDEKDNQIQALQFTNEKHLQKILRLNKEIDDLIENRPVVDLLATCCVSSKKKGGEVHPYYVIRCQYRQLGKYKRWLKIRYTNMEVVDKCDDPNAIYQWKRFKHEVIKKPNYYRNHFRLTKRNGNFLKLTWMSIFKAKEFSILYPRQQNIMIKNIY